MYVPFDTLLCRDGGGGIQSLSDISSLLYILALHYVHVENAYKCMIYEGCAQIYPYFRSQSTSILLKKYITLLEVT